MPYASSNNAILIDNCNNLQNLTVLLEVTEDLATTNNGGWSLQLNCYAPPGQYCQTSQVNVLQYIVIVQGGILQYYIQYWAYGTSTWPSGYNPQPGTSPWLPCWAHDYGIAPTFATGLSGDTLPRESTLQIALATNSDGGVTTATFTYTDPDDNVQTGVWKAPAVLPICAFQLNFVGPPGGTANFTQGLLNSRGIIYYTISSGELSVQSGGPGSACGEPGAGTAETSNMTYSDINGAPASTVTQILQQPIPCVIDSVYLTDPAHLGEMKQLRDTEVAKVPAGQWLLEVLDRHSADLALIVAANDVGLGRPARDLLTRAVQIAREGRVFDEAAIDEAMKVWEQVSCKLPPSMNGVGPAGATVLRSLRGRTFQEGLKEASRTIRPRFKAARK